MLLSQIRTDGGTQPRAVIDDAVVQEYAEAMREGAKFPPVVVFNDGYDYWLADGFHRVAAAKVARFTEIDADEREGLRRDAVLYAMGANANHGVRRTNADKRRAVTTLLKDPEWMQWSDREIARRCAVDHKTVAALREQLSLGNFPGDSRQVTYTDRWGNESVMIPGKRQPEPDIEPEDAQYGDDPEDWDIPFTDEPEPQLEARKSLATFNRTNSNVDWAWWTWNPVTGCKHGCAYCYARDIANRFTGHFEPELHPDRLDAPQNTREPVLPSDASQADRLGSRCVFVCSMADLFGAWVPQEWIDAVLDAVRKAPQWTFIFLTKNPSRLIDIDWPKNAWVGTTVDVNARAQKAQDAFSQIDASVRFLSCEPLNERVQFTDLSMFDWVLIGGRSKTSGAPAFQPEWAWVEDILRKARQARCAVYFKPNLEARPREYPAGE